MSRITFHNMGINVDYRRSDYTFKNKYFDNAIWRCKSEWFFRIGFEKKWYEKDNFHYDGHYMKSITLLGVQFALGYTYDSRPVAGWHKEEK